MITSRLQVLVVIVHAHHHEIHMQHVTGVAQQTSNVTSCVIDIAPETAQSSIKLYAGIPDPAFVTR